MNFVNIGTIFDKFPVKFPVNDKLKIIYGNNGSGKTQTLKLLKKWYEEQNEVVVYFSEDRYKPNCNFDDVIASQMMAKLISGYDPYDKHKINIELLEPAFKRGLIDGGNIQFANFIGTIMKYSKPVVLIDLPETNLHISIQRHLIDDIMNCCMPKNLVIVTHNPSIIENNFQMLIDIKDCVIL